MRCLAGTRAAGVAFRPVGGRSLVHTQRHLRVTPAAAASSRAGTPATAACLNRTRRQFYSWDARRAICRNAAQEKPAHLSCLIPSAAGRRLQSTAAAPKTTPTPPSHQTFRKSSFVSPRYLPILVLLAIGGVAWDSQWLFPATPSSSDQASQTILGDARKFVRFDVVARDQVSPSSFILTLKAPATTKGHLHSVASLWDVFDLWCVEVKQPQIQVAREYTPLPPPPGAADEDTLRLYVRAVRGGEVSTYLSRLSPPSPSADGPAAGDTVELRGPHGEFDLRSRLGGRGDRVVFLAGGTGIASALQAARAVLPLAGGPFMTIFWAVRGRDEIQQGGRAPGPARPTASWSWNPFSSRRAPGPGIQAEALSAETAAPSPIARELLALKEEYGDRIDVRVVVDQEGTAVRDSDLAAALARPGPKSPGSAGLPSPPPPTHAVEGCKFHSQAAHVGMVDGAPNAGKRALFKREDCPCPSGPGGGAPPGKNLFVVSGPEGFVEAYAGAKLWWDGGQLQGPVGGVLGALQRGNPDVLKDWVVLKL